MTDIHDLETDEEVGEYRRHRLQYVAFEAKELILHSQRQLAGLRVMYSETKENLGLYRRCSRRAAEAGKAEKAAEFRNSLRKCIEYRKLIRKRMQTLERVCREMEDVLREAKMRGSDA